LSVAGVAPADVFAGSVEGVSDARLSAFAPGEELLPRCGCAGPVTTRDAPSLERPETPGPSIGCLDWFAASPVWPWVDGRGVALSGLLEIPPPVLRPCPAFAEGCRSGARGEPFTRSAGTFPPWGWPAPRGEENGVGVAPRSVVPRVGGTSPPSREVSPNPGVRLDGLAGAGVRSTLDGRMVALALPVDTPVPARFPAPAEPESDAGRPCVSSSRCLRPCLADAA